MNLIEAFGKTLPTSIKSIIRGDIRKKESRKLNLLSTIYCDTTNLLDKNEVDLVKILNAEEIDSAWAESKKDIDVFNIPDSTGGVNPGDRRAIYYLIKHFKPKSVLEIGTHLGASTISIASALRKNQVEDELKSILKTVDIRDVNSVSEKPWLQFGSEKSPIEMIKLLKYESFVEFIASTSFKYFETNVEQFDFIFLDGDHSSNTVYREIPLALEKLKKNGVILLHDYFPNCKPLWSNNTLAAGPYLATERLISEGTNVSIIPLGDLPWPTKLNSNITSLALLVRKD